MQWTSERDEAQSVFKAGDTYDLERLSGDTGRSTSILPLEGDDILPTDVADFLCYLVPGKGQ